MQNYHRHTSYSNISTPDSAATNEDYAKREAELGRKILSSVEHGWQGAYHEVYELAHKYGLKCVIGAEAYWVLDRQKEYPTGKRDKDDKEILAKDKTNNHIIILAMNNNGREDLNDILSEANISGYYFKPRIDLDLLLKLPAENVIITTACIAFNGYGYEESDRIIKQLHNHFGNHLYLEVQYHNTKAQIEWNKHLAYLSETLGIEMIVGLDSHYCLEEESWQRDYILDAKGMHYKDEEGWYMDDPDNETVMNRFLEQGVFNREQIQHMMDNTDITLTFDDYDDVPVFNKDIKLPTLYPGETKEEKDKRYGRLITQKFKSYTKGFTQDEYNRYFEGVRMEVQTYKDTGMVDYPLLDYAIVKDAKEHGGLITDTGRGSAVGYLTNTLCGFSNVDRFQSAIKLYPERFISTTRILETHSLPDIDLNTGTPEILEESQIRILGQDHVYPMIAFGTLKKKAAFKMYARAKNMNFELANTISQQIDKYELDLKHAEDEDKDSIDIYDYVDEQYWTYLDQSKEYWGIISDKKKAPSAYLLYQGNIRREIGLIKCKSESTKKEYITCVINGAVAEGYKFLKNDILKVDVVLLIDKVFKRIGIEHFDVPTLINKLKNDPATWDIYANGYTVGVNQVEKDGSRHRCMNYKPKNLSELSAFVAAIRPGFKSMYSKFESREDFSYGIDVLDNMLRTEELSHPFIFFQEQCMSVLNYAGFPMDQCYGIIKAIAKKHPEKVKPLKAQFLEGFKKQVMLDENVDESKADEYANTVWTVVNDNCGYSFNASHAYCMALDSSYQAWQKAHYPYEFYEVNLQHFTEKGKKDKVIELKSEMKKAFGISEGAYKFGNDNRKFTADKEHKCIHPMISSIKGFSNSIAENFWELSQKKHYVDFIDLLIDIVEYKCCDSSQLDTLIKIGYFSDFGQVNELLEKNKMFNTLYKKKQFSKKDLKGIPEYILAKYSKETEKQFREISWTDVLNEWIVSRSYPETSIIDKINYEYEMLGYIITTMNVDESYNYVLDIRGYSNNILDLYELFSGNTWSVKYMKRGNDTPEIGEIIDIIELSDEKKWKKDENDQWYQIEDTEKKIKKFQKVVDIRK